MPSHSILPEARRAAIAAAFDEALAEVRAAGDVALLQECRAIFRRRVPLNLRAYVAAALVLKNTGSGRTLPRKGDRQNERQKDRQSDHQNESTKDRGGRNAKREVPVREASASQRTEQAARQPEVREVRENRYRGEGVTLFVSAGRRQRFYARIAIKVLLEIPGVTDAAIGDIRTMDNYSFIVVDPDVEELVIAALNGYDFKGRTLAVNRARKKGEAEPLSDAPEGIDAADAGVQDEADLDSDDESGSTEDV
ncbi:MAG TPA: DbpA RNA binding domain-containing protein [bacterium]|nr:DbpA RNA binding domain-containing protein [bacterium]